MAEPVDLQRMVRASESLRYDTGVCYECLIDGSYVRFYTFYAWLVMTFGETSKLPYFCMHCVEHTARSGGNDGYLFSCVDPLRLSHSSKTN